MDCNDGMVAVVRGLGDSGLTVTLLDGAREYTLVPNSVLSTSPVSKSSPRQHSMHHRVDSGTDYSLRDVGAQIVDARYASTYRTTHCNVKPTSPPIELTEFPPQRADYLPGQDNFEVGGGGSGEVRSQVRSQQSTSARYCGALVWQDRGSVCTPKTAPPADAFASSLRKYPCLSPERSSEIVERLVSYTQSKNSNRTHTIRNQTSPQRLSDLSACDCRKPTKAFTPKAPPCWASVDRGRLDESPTREVRVKKAEGDGPEAGNAFNRNYEVKCLRDIARRVKEHSRLSASPYTQPVCPHIRDNCCSQLIAKRSSRPSTNKTNTEIQAVVEMVSKEVATVPGRDSVSKRTVAVLVAPISSMPGKITLKTRMENKSNQTLFEKHFVKRKSVQTSSFTDLKRKDHIPVNQMRKIKSQEQIIADKVLEKCILEIFNDTDLKIKSTSNTDEKLNKSFISTDFNTKLHANMNPIPGFQIRAPRNISKDFDKEKNPSMVALLHGNLCSMVPAELNLNNNTNIECREMNLAIKHWVESLPMRNLSIDKNQLDKCIDEKRVCCDIFKVLNKYIKNKYVHDINNVKTAIVDIIKDLPIELEDDYKNLDISGTVDALLKRIRNIFRDDECKILNASQTINSPKIIKTHAIEENLKHLINRQLELYLKTYHLEISKRLIQDVQNELSDILMNSIDWFSSECESDLKFQIKYILKDVANWTDIQADDFINDILIKLAADRNINSYNQTYTVLPSTVHNNSVLNSHNHQDLNANLDFYMKMLCDAIDDWLNTLNIHDIKDKGFREVVIHDLAGDIVDRHKYLDMNPSSRGSDEDELEHLKYQIFKWVNKLVGESNTETIKHAAELMNRIRSIPVPILVMPGNINIANIDSFADPVNCRDIHNPNSGLSRDSSQCRRKLHFSSDPKIMIANNSNKSKTQNVARSPQWLEKEELKSGRASGVSIPQVKPSSVMSVATKQTRKSSPGRINKGDENIVKVDSPQRVCCMPKDDYTAPSVKSVNEHYDQYVKQWVQEIPIAATTPDQSLLANKLRLGIYNGIWKALTKLQFEPEIYKNRFYYQDKLYDEIEELLNLLPQSPELLKKKQLMKAKFVEKTSEINDILLSAAAPASYKQQLIENVENNLTKIDLMNEEHQKAKLVNDFILYTRYKDDNILKANVYKNRLLKHVEELVQDIKQRHGRELKDIDPLSYVHEIMAALNRVPIPDEDTIREEADEVLLITEIEQWFKDLPITVPDDDTEGLQLQILREGLAKSVHNIQKDKNLSSCAGEKGLREEISKFLEKVPLREGTDKDFVTGELVNRLQNMPKDNAPRRKSVSFRGPGSLIQFQHHSGTIINDPQDYDEFSRNMPHASSMVDRQVQNDEYSNPSQPSEVDWLSLMATKMPSALRIGNETRDSSNLQPQNDIVPPLCAPNCSQGLAQSSNPLRENTYHDATQRSIRSPNIQQIRPYPSPDRPAQPPEQMLGSQKSRLYTSHPVPGHLGTQTPADYKVFSKSVDQIDSYNNQNAPNFTIPMPNNNMVPNNRNQTGGGMGILGTSQIPGPSGIRATTTQPCCDQGTGSNASIQPSWQPSSSQPVGFLTPQQSPREGTSPQRPTRRPRPATAKDLDAVRRRLDLADDTDEEGIEREAFVKCLCRLRRGRRRRPMMCPVSGVQMQCPHCLQIRCPYAYFL